MEISWKDVLKIIAILSGTGLTLAGISTFFVWLFKEWVLNLFRKDLNKQESKLSEKLKEKELNWQKENKAIELRLGEEIRKSELQISKLINFEQKHYDILLKSYRGTWVKLIELEEYVIREYPYYLQSLKSNDLKDYAKPIREKIHPIRKEILFLPKEISDKVEKLITSFFEDFSNFIAVGKSLADAKKPNSKGQVLLSGNSLKPLESSLNTLQMNLGSRINSLKEDFQKNYLNEMKK